MGKAPPFGLQVEFQRNYRVTVRMHMDALLAKRAFWETLLRNNVTFDLLADAVKDIEKTVKAAESTYKQVLTVTGFLGAGARD